MKNTPATALRFFWNGIKGSDGKLQRCTYSGSQLLRSPEGTITIYGKQCRDFSPEVRAQFVVRNDSDPTTDYCVNDQIRVTPDHLLYADVSAALRKAHKHYEGRFARLASANAALEATR